MAVTENTMRSVSAAGILLATLSVAPQQCAAPRRSAVPPQSPVILGATNVIYGVGHYVGTTLLVRLHEDGTVEWETELDARKREKHVTQLTADVLKSIRDRLNTIDQSSFTDKMGPYARYVDTGVVLKIHLASHEHTKDFVIINPWPSHYNSKPVPEPVQQLLCELRRLRALVSGEQLPVDCKDQPAPAN